MYIQRCLLCGVYKGVYHAATMNHPQVITSMSGSVTIEPFIVSEFSSFSLYIYLKKLQFIAFIYYTNLQFIAFIAEWSFVCWSCMDYLRIPFNQREVNCPHIDPKLSFVKIQSLFSKGWSSFTLAISGASW